LDFVKVILLALKKAGIRGFGRKGFFEQAKPSVLAASGDTRIVNWNEHVPSSYSFQSSKSMMVDLVPLATPSLRL
jgi:hypothetical protein